MIRRRRLFALSSLVLVSACTADTCGGKTLGKIHLDPPKTEGSVTIDLPPDSEIVLYENHATAPFGDGKEFRNEKCFRLDVTLEQGGETTKLQCIPLGGRRDTTCLNTHSGATNTGTACKTVNCETTLARGGETVVRAKRLSLQPCSWKPVRHTILIKRHMSW